MEYAEGANIIDYCSSKKVDINTRIKMFTILCNAVQHAHQNLIIHRDIKPENIIVTQVDELKLLDFGIAKIIQDSENVTKTQMHAMTPAYASPEQFMGKTVGVASDVYSLGVLLYELLTGKRPNEPKGHSPLEFEKQLRETNPVKPSGNLSSTIPKNWSNELSGDLDKIILKALQFDISQRYHTVAEFVDDLNRYNDNLPVRAQIPSFNYRIKKFVKRNKLLLLSIILLLTFITTFITILLVQANRLTQQRNHALNEQIKAQTLSDVFIQAFKMADPIQINSNKITALDVMRVAEKIINERSFQDPLVKSKLLLSVSRVYLNMSEFRKVLELLSFIDENFELLSKSEKIEYISIKALGLKSIKGQEDKVISMMKKAIFDYNSDSKLVYTFGLILKHYVRYDIAEVFLEKHFLKLAKDNKNYLPICSIYGYILALSDKSVKSIEVFDQCESVINRQHNSNLWIQSNIYFQKGKAYLWMDDPESAIFFFKKALNIRTSLFGENNVYAMDIGINIGDALIDLGRVDEALIYIDQGLKARQSLFINNIEDSSISKPLVSKAKAYYKLEDYNQAESLLNKAIRLRIKGGSGKNFNTGVYYKELAKTNLKLNKTTQAIQNLNSALEVFQDKRYKNDKYNISETQFYLAKSYLALNDNEKASMLLDKAIPALNESHLKSNAIFQELENLQTQLKRKN